MLRAGMMTAGQMNIDRRVERNAGFAPARDLLGVALGVGGGKLAAGIAGAGDEAGADGVGLDGKAERFDALLRLRELLGRHAGDQQILPDREAQIAVAELARDRGKSVHLRDRHPPDRHDDADPVRAPPASGRERRYARYDRRPAAAPTRPGTARSNLRPSLSSSRPTNFSMPMASSTYFSRALVRSVRSPCSMKTPHHGVGDLAGVLRLHQHAGIAGEIVMPGDAAETELEPDAGRQARSRRSPAPPGSRCRWCPPAPRSCRRRRRRR